MMKIVFRFKPSPVKIKTQLCSQAESSMTLQEKIDRFLAEAPAQRIGAWSAAPPVIRLAWALAIDVAPPHFWSFRALALFQGILFGVIFFGLNVLFFDERWQRQFLTSAFAALLFGLLMAWASRRTARRSQFSSWGSREN